jgi:hypothetical protein
LPSSCDALEELAQMTYVTSYDYDTLPRDDDGKIDESRFRGDDGRIQNAWAEAGIVLGLAMGLRLRGWGGAR